MADTGVEKPLTIKIPLDENEKAALAKARARAAKEKQDAADDAKCAGCMSIFFCCLLFQ
jgi:hypothetical protein